MSCSDFNLAHAFFAHAKAQPDHPALWVDDRTYTYAELAEAAGRVAAALRSQADVIGPAPRVGILAGRSFETYAGILGTCWAGGTYVPMNPKQPAKRLSDIADRAKLGAIFADRRGAKHLGEMTSALPRLVIAPAEAVAPDSAIKLTTWESLRPQRLADITPPAAVTADHPAYVIFTSGTTGVPKGVAVSVANVAHFVGCMRAMHHLGSADRAAQFFETSFDVSVCEMFCCWDAGATLYVVPDVKVMAPAGFLQQHEITFWMGVPSAIQVMHRFKQLSPGAFPKMRVSGFGGESFTAELARLWQSAAPNSTVYNMYGPTEATVACLQQLFSETAIETPDRGTLSIGKPHDGLHAAVVGPAGEFLKSGQTGELAVCGPQVALGYFGDEEFTARRFITLNHPEIGASRWYLTGDLALCDDAGFFHCLGRIDHQVKVMGHRVELEEVEAHLREVCKTQDVAAVAWPLVNGNAAGIVGFVSGGAMPSSVVRDELRRRVPPYMIPSRVLTLEAIPLSMNGKIDRKALSQMLEREGVAAL